MSYVLSLEREKFPGISKVRRLPDIEEQQTKSFGKVFEIKYFFFKGNEKPIMIGFSSKDKSFKSLSFITLYNLRLQPVIILATQSEVDKDQLINGVGQLISKSKYFVPAMSKFKRENYLYQSEQAPPGIFIRFAQALGILAAATYLLQSWIVKLLKASEERTTSKLEDENNKLLFYSQEKNDPAFAMFGNMVKNINMVIKNQAMAVIICGPPGMSKTYTVRRTLHFSGLKPGKDYSIEKGTTLGLMSTYDMLYKYRNKILVLDDFDKPLTNPEIVNLLKGITDTYAKRIISLPRIATSQAGLGGSYSPTPEKFEFKGRVIIITNLTKSQIDSALLSRAPAVEVFFDTKKVMEGISKMIKYTHPNVDEKLKWEVYHYLEKLYAADPKVDITFRSFINAVNARVGSPEDWKEITHLIVNYKGKKIVESYLSTLF